MSSIKQLAKGHDVKFITKWEPPTGDDLRPLIAMPNIPRPCHLLNPRNILGPSAWNRIRKECYAEADDTCEICGDKPENLKHRHAHEVYEIDYENGIVKFVRAFCVCALDHIGAIHTGRAITMYKNGSPLFPKEFLLEGAEKAFKTIYEYNRDNPGADLRAYINFLEYLKFDDLKDDMNALIEKYNVKFYAEDPDRTAKWGDWKLIIDDQEYPTPYKNEKAWKKAMEEQEKKDTDRILTKSMTQIFSGEIYDELNKILKEV